MLHKLDSKSFPVFVICFTVSFIIMYKYFDILNFQNHINNLITWEASNMTTLLKNTTYGSIIKTLSSDNCKLWKIVLEDHPMTLSPRIILDPNKFLYPGLIWGPNNQIVGLLQSIYLAIKLNRTLVIPKFRAHFTSKGNKVQKAGTRIDVDYLRSFISTISIDQLQNKCNGSFDVAFQAQIVNPNAIYQIEEDTKLKVFQGGKQNWTDIEGAFKLRLFAKYKGLLTIPTFPNAKYTPTYSPWLSGNANDLRKAYNSSLPCAAYIAPFYTIRLGMHNRVASPLPNVTNITYLTNDVLYSAVVDSIKHPVCIVEAAKDFLKQAFRGKQYVAVHWRYDPSDWGQRCKGKNEDWKKSTCGLITTMTPEDFLNGIINTLISKNIYFNNTLYLYIAVPSSLKTYKENILLFLNKTNLLQTNLDLTNVLTKNYKNCWDKNWENFDEIFSLVEMEIMKKSEIFFHSPGSTWSSNILPKRTKTDENGLYQQKYSVSILNTVRTAVEKRLANHNNSETQSLK